MRRPLPTALLLLLAACATGILSLFFATGPQGFPMFLSYFKLPLLVFLNIAPVALLALALWFATGRAHIAYALTALVTMGFTFGNYYKLLFRDDPVIAEDVTLLIETAQMAQSYNLTFSKRVVAGAALCVLAAVFLALFARARPGGWKTRLGGALGGALALFLLVRYGCMSWSLYQRTANEGLINRWSTTAQFTSRGFVYPFLYSINAAKDSPPAGYDADLAAAALAQYADADIPESEKVSVVGVMLEAFADFSQYEYLGIDESVYAAWHALEAESYAGTLVTDIFAGGTITSERAFLTGLTDQGSYRRPTNSYVRYFAAQGYTVEGSHPCYDWFYNRKNINANLGFTDYYFLENRYAAFSDGFPVADYLYLPTIYERFAANKETGRPFFSFNITYQNHGPYSTEPLADRDWFSYADCSEATRNIFNNYLEGVRDTGACLARLVEQFRADEDPVVLVLFGDHKPWLGDESFCYAELGIDLTGVTSDETAFYNYYATPYLIWANDAAKAALGADFTGAGPTIGPYFLMDELFRLAGWDGSAFMQLSREAKGLFPVVSGAQLVLLDGALTSSLSAEQWAVLQRFHWVQYYYRRNFLY